MRLVIAQLDLTSLPYLVQCQMNAFLGAAELNAPFMMSHFEAQPD
jgi:hypothetical protein